MKNKILSIAILFSLTIAFTACGNQETENNDDSATPHLIEHLTKESLKEKVFDYENNEDWNYLGSEPCIIDFYASWCAPCRILAPTLDKMAKKYDGQIKIYKVNIDKEKELATAFGVQSIPTMLLCPLKKDPYIHKGLMSETDLEAAINDFLLQATDSLND